MGAPFTPGAISGRDGTEGIFCSNSYLVMQSKRFQNKEEIEWVRKISINEHFVFVVIVCDEDDTLIQIVDYSKDDNGKGRRKKGSEISMFSQEESKKIKNTKFIVIGNEKNHLGYSNVLEDVIGYQQFNKDFRKTILSLNVSFQGKDLNVQDLVESEEAKKVLDRCSIKELTSVGGKVIIPSFTNITSPYNPQLFIERRVILPIGKNFHGQLASEMGYSMPTLLKKHGTTHKEKSNGQCSAAKGTKYGCGRR